MGTVTNVKGKLWRKISDKPGDWTANWKLLGTAPSGWKTGDPVPKEMEDGEEKSSEPETTESKTDYPELPKMKTVAELGGTTGAKIVNITDPDSGAVSTVIYKTGKSAGHIEEENTANSIYQAIGVPAHRSLLYQDGEHVAMLENYNDGLASADTSKEIHDLVVEDAKHNFVSDALMANWDVVGADYDNMMWDSVRHRTVRVDNGGALRYRAQGGKQGTAFGAKVTELDSMRDPKTGAGRLYNGVTDAQVKTQIDYVLTRKDKILAAISDDGLKATMEKRLDYLQKWLPKAAAPTNKFGPRLPKVPIGEYPRPNPQHKEALSSYQNGGYGAINGALRDYQAEDDPETWHAIQALDDYIDQTPVHSISTQRTVSAKMMEKFFGGLGFPPFKIETMADANKTLPNGTTYIDMLQKWTKGAIFGDQGFVSTTSANRHVGYNGVTQAGAVVKMFITGKSRAVDYNSIPGYKSQYPEEKEILLPRGTKFRIDKLELLEGVGKVGIGLHVSIVEDF